MGSVSDSDGRQRCKPFGWRMSSATYGGLVQGPESLMGRPPWAEVERPVMCSKCSLSFRVKGVCARCLATAQ